ncbi:hypothetical protein AAFC00_000789 [Neodothiora populina]|uniref:Prolyl 4-hydroxylase alpha subunit domain-containing protein n=1 Tax=Neodothiora populina TaxID=2781224 RepID=A0ABR3PLR7_9PEZI
MAPKPKSKPTTKASTGVPRLQQQQPQQPPQRPNWPALTPLPSPLDLTLTTLVPNQILTIPNLFTSSLCQKYVSFLKSLPLVTTPGKPKRGDAVRVNDRYQIDDAEFARRLWEETALKSLVLQGDVDYDGDGVNDGDDEAQKEKRRREVWGGEVVGLNPNIRIYRYSEGQFFDQHYDDSNTILIPASPSQPAGKPLPAKTTWTLLLYLTTCSGGETVFYPDPPAGKRTKSAPPISAAPEVGLALLHRHGGECMLHEGKEVRGGEKWVLRSDLCVRR